MKLIPLAFLFFLLSTEGNFCRAESTLSSNYISNGIPLYWSIKPVNSVYDSLKAEAKKSVLTDDSHILNEYILALQFRNQLGVAAAPLPISPISAGIYTGTLYGDSLSADDQLLFLYRNLGDRKAEAELLSSLGIKAAVKGDLDKAQLLLKEALYINEEIKNKPAVLKNYLSLARIYHFKKAFEDAKMYNEYILRLASAGADNSYLAIAYANLIEICTIQQRYKEAESMVMTKALPLNYYKLKSKAGTIKCYDQLAAIYQAQKRLSEAKWFYIQANMLARKTNDTQEIVNSLVNLAKVKTLIGDYQLALSDFGEAETLSRINNFGYKMVEIKNEQSKVYNMMGNTGAAHSAMSEYTTLKKAFLSTIH